MTKDTYYFSHDYNSRNDQKILLLRSKYHAEGYGIFWMLIEIMAESTLPHIHHFMVPAIAVSINVEPNRLSEIIEFCIKDCKLFVSDGHTFTSMRLMKHRKFREDFRYAGYRGAMKRWNNSPPNSPPNGDGNAKESKVNESKLNTETVFSEFYSRYPKKQGKQDAFKAFRSINPNNELLERMLLALREQSASESWKKEDGKFIPLPATWLRGRRWEDEIQTTQVKKHESKPFPTNA